MLSRPEPAIDIRRAQTARLLFWRRAAFAAGVLATMAGLLWLLAKTLAPGGLSALDVVLLVLFAITLPWTVIGFWNAAIGFVLMRFSPNTKTTNNPTETKKHSNEPNATTTAIL